MMYICHWHGLKKSGLKATSSCSDTYSEYFVQGEEPKSCEGHSLKICSDSGKLATDHCPNTYYYSFLPEKERNPSWKTEGSSSSAPSDYCTIHTNNSNNTNPDNNDNNSGATVTTTTDIVIPNVVGATKAEAVSKLSGLTIVYGKPKSDSSKADGIVLSQSLAPGLVVEKGTKITITLNEVKEETPTEPKTPTDPNKPVTDPTKPTDNTITNNTTDTSENTP